MLAPVPSMELESEIIPNGNPDSDKKQHALVKKSGPVCILCYERDHRHCHRRWIAEIIEERDGVRVNNLAGKQA